MKIVIDIDDNMFKSIKKANMDDAKAVICNYHATITIAIRNGTPLNKIRAEIIELRSKQNVGVLECLDIIDKYKAESEG